MPDGSYGFPFDPKQTLPRRFQHAETTAPPVRIFRPCYTDGRGTNYYLIMCLGGPDGHRLFQRYTDRIVRILTIRLPQQTMHPVLVYAGLYFGFQILMFVVLELGLLGTVNPKIVVGGPAGLAAIVGTWVPKEEGKKRRDNARPES